MISYDVVIVGAGHAGAQTAIGLRQQRFAGSILVISDEEELPYERPPLSKDYLKGDRSFERLLLRPPAFWEERTVVFRLGDRVDSVDPTARTLATMSGISIGYGKLVWATGGAPRRLTCHGHNLTGVHCIRTRRDVDTLKAEIEQAREVVVIGGGYIGLEAAAVLTQLGNSVTLIEAQDRLLSRVAGPELAGYMAAEHRRQGVTLLLKEEVVGLLGAERVTAVQLAGGEIIKADLVIVGIGIVPAVQPLLNAGAKGGNGVWVDERGRTSLPHIWAAGDCALHSNPWAAGRNVRLESVQNANDQATTVAADIAGHPASYGALPWFWSDQYDLKLQTVGLSLGHDATVVRGKASDRSFSILYMRAGKLIAVDAINAVKDYAAARRFIGSPVRIDPALLADTRRPLKDWLTSGDNLP